MTREGCSFSQNTPLTAYRKGCRCPECREAKQERNRACYLANREAVLEHQRAYCLANREAVLEYRRAYRQANPEAGRGRGQAWRRWQRAAAPGMVTGPWSPAEDAVLAGWGFTTLALAQALGRSYGSCRQRRRLLRKKGLLPLPEVA